MFGYDKTTGPYGDDKEDSGMSYTTVSPAYFDCAYCKSRFYSYDHVDQHYRVAHDRQPPLSIAESSIDSDGGADLNSDGLTVTRHAPDDCAICYASANSHSAVPLPDLVQIGNSRSEGDDSSTDRSAGEVDTGASGERCLFGSPPTPGSHRCADGHITSVRG